MSYVFTGTTFDEYKKWTIISKKIKDENLKKLDINKEGLCKEV